MDRDTVKEKKREIFEATRNVIPGEYDTIDLFYKWHIAELEKATPQRRGQYLFNQLVILFPKEVEKLRGTDKDPFHHDEKCIKFIQEIIEDNKREARIEAYQESFDAYNIIQYKIGV